MIIDVAIALIVLLFLFLGFKNGFVRTLLHTFGWALAIIAAAFLRKPFGNVVAQHTTLREFIYGKTETLLQSLSSNVVDGITSGGNDVSGTTGDGARGIPGALGDGLQTASGKVTRVATEQITDVLFTIIIFLTLLVLIKLAFFIITVIFSKKYRRGGIAFGLDGFVGALLGIAQAALLVFVLLAILLPASYVINPSAYDWVVHQMDRSIFAQTLYEHNPLLSLVQEYLPSDLLPAEWFA